MRVIVVIFVAVVTILVGVGALLAIGHYRETKSESAAPADSSASPTAINPVAAPASPANPPVSTVATPANVPTPTASPATPGNPAATPPPSAPDADGVIVLKSEAARIHGFQLRLDRIPVAHLTYWIDGTEFAEWSKTGLKPGKYTVEITYACAPSAGGNFFFIAGTQQIAAHVDPTGAWTQYRPMTLPPLTLTDNNPVIYLKPNGPPQFALMNLAKIRLIPAK